MPYQYQALGRTKPAIRLCEIYPGSNGDPIACKMFHADLEYVKCKYSALSYTWGSPGNPKTRPAITINGTPHTIQPNLMLALLGLRHSDQSITLWIDAICINQQDIQERNHQVVLMSHIYKYARDVRVWLGETADNSQEVFKFCKDFATLASGLGLDGEAIQYTECRAQLESRSQEPSGFVSGLRELTATATFRTRTERAIQSLCQRDYWTRAWIVQEFILGRRIIIHCGTDKMPWHPLGLFLSLNPTRNTAIHDVGTRFFVERLNFQNELNYSHDRTLPDLLEAFAGSACTEPRDRVFSLLSLASDCRGKEQYIVDYNMPLSSLLWATINVCKPSDILRHAGVVQRALWITTSTLIKSLEPTTFADSDINSWGSSSIPLPPLPRQQAEEFKHGVAAAKANLEAECLSSKDMRKEALKLLNIDAKIGISTPQEFSYRACALAQRAVEYDLRRDELYELSGFNLGLRCRPWLEGRVVVAYSIITWESPARVGLGRVHTEATKRHSPAAWYERLFGALCAAHPRRALCADGPSPEERKLPSNC